MNIKKFSRISINSCGFKAILFKFIKVYIYLLLEIVLRKNSYSNIDRMNQIMRAVAFKPPGQVTDLFISSTTPVPTLKPSECLVKVVYSGLNRADIQQRRGLYPPPPGASEILGLEAVGRVVKCADGGEAAKWKPGDRVMCLLSGGGQAEYVAAHQANIIRMPDWMSWRQAACVPEAWLTAFQLLYWVSGFTKTFVRREI